MRRLSRGKVKAGTIPCVPRSGSLWTARRLTVWGTALLVLSWFIYVHTMAVPGYIDRAGRFKGTDYLYFYVMGSLVLHGRTDALYQPDEHLAEGRRRIGPDLKLYAPYSNYGPQVALAFAPLAVLPFGWSLAVFLALTAVFYAASVWIVWRECPGLQPYGRLVFILAAASPLFLTLFRYAQLSALSLLLLSAAFVALKRGRPTVAGLLIGSMVFKPQLGLVLGVVFLATRQWRVVAAAILAAAAQLGLAWLVGGSQVMADYFGVLWLLMRNPGLVQIYPSEVHSLRGFFHLLIAWPPVVTALSLAGLVAALMMAVKTWRSGAELSMKWGEVIVLTILASPHLLSYDLVLLSVPLLLAADWTIRHPDHPATARVEVLVLLAYLAPFSSNFARLYPVQTSVIVLALLAWDIFRIANTPKIANIPPGVE